MIRKFFLLLIRFYKSAVSPYLGNNCRFTPTCSEYTYEAISRYGAFKGSWMGFKRIMRCNPFCKGGFDPVK